MSYGSDVSVIPDLDDTWGPLTGPRAVGEALVRRFSTPRGTLPFEPSYGTDLRMYLGMDMTAANLAQMRSAAKTEALKDERITDVEVLTNFEPLSGRVMMRITGTLSDSTSFSLVLAVSALTIDLLEAR